MKEILLKKVSIGLCEISANEIKILKKAIKLAKEIEKIDSKSAR